MSDDRNVPEILWHYTDLRNECRLRNKIVHREIYFQDPDDFNDPFDCKTGIDIRRATTKDWKTHVRYENQYRINSGEKSWTAEQIKRRVYQYKHCESMQNKVREGWENTYKAEIKKFGVLCLSEKNNDILMWSHYSDKHQGVCLGFDYTDDIMKKIQTRVTSFIRDYVRYCKHFVTLNEFNDPQRFFQGLTISKDQAAFLLFMSRKSEQWTYENEWRLFLYKNGEAGLENSERTLIYPEKALEKIALGCQISTENREKIYQWVDEYKNRYKREIEVIEFEENPDEFSLRPKE